MSALPPKADITSNRHAKHKKGTAGRERRSDPFCDPPKWGHPGLGIRRLMTLMSVRWIDFAVRLITSPEAMRLFVTPNTRREAEYGIGAIVGLLIGYKLA
jgi:hypothetical protein